MVGGALSEGLQALTPDRRANLVAAFCDLGGVPAAALLAEFFIRVRRWCAGAPRPNLCLRKIAEQKLLIASLKRLVNVHLSTPTGRRHSRHTRLAVLSLR